MRCARACRYALRSVHALDLSLAPALLTSARKRSHSRDWQHASKLLIERTGLLELAAIILDCCSSYHTAKANSWGWRGGGRGGK